jgi:hypothetical protein
MPKPAKVTIEDNLVIKSFRLLSPFLIREVLVYNSINTDLAPSSLNYGLRTLKLEFIEKSTKDLNLKVLANSLARFNESKVWGINLTYFLSLNNFYLSLTLNPFFSIFIERMRNRISLFEFRELTRFFLKNNTKIYRKFLIHNDLRSLQTNNYIFSANENILFIDFEVCKMESKAIFHDLFSLAFNPLNNDFNLKLIEEYFKFFKELGLDKYSKYQFEKALNLSVMKVAFRYLRQFNDHTLINWIIGSKTNFNEFNVLVLNHCFYGNKFVSSYFSIY